MEGEPDIELRENLNDAPETNDISLEPNDKISEPIDEAKSEYDKPATMTEIWPDYCNPNYEMPDLIEVKVTKDSSFSKESYIFPVWIQKFDPKSTPKPFLGGYRNKKSGREYHHASSQTPTEALAGMKASFSLLGTKKIKDTSNLRTRETQTSEWKSRSMQTTREFGTQMERIDLRLDPSKKNEIILSPRKYRTAEELLIIKKEKCIVIQRCWRGFWARKRAKDIKIRNREFELEQQREREQKIELEKELKSKDMARRSHPKSNLDFAILYNELDTWRKSEIAKIKSSIPDLDQRQKAMSELLDNEVKALQQLQQLKMSAQQQWHDERTKKRLDLMASPNIWQLSTAGGTNHIPVVTPDILKAQQLKELYELLVSTANSQFDKTTAGTAKTLNSSTLTMKFDADKRLDVLLRIKWAVKEWNTNLTREITELIDREADLVGRQRPPQSMNSLRYRLHNLFLQFVEDPVYNPRAADFLIEK